MARPLPKKGFYVWNVHKWLSTTKFTDEERERVLAAQPDTLNDIYCSGTTKGNYYYDPQHHSDQWNFLTWTCVPSVKHAESEYDYHEENPTDKSLPLSE